MRIMIDTNVQIFDVVGIGHIIQYESSGGYMNHPYGEIGNRPNLRIQSGMSGPGGFRSPRVGANNVKCAGC